MALTGKIAIVTGAAQGIGAAIAAHLLKAGARVALVDVKAEALEAAVAGMGGTSPDLMSLTVDLADSSAARTVPGRVAARFGGVDILVNNAGVRSIAPLADYPLDQWRLALEVNLTAPFVLTQAVVPLMLERRKGKIVNVTSIASELGIKNRVAYNVSKAGLTMLTKSTALELAAQGIRCNAVAPGIIETPLNSNYFSDAELTKKIVDATPAGTWGHTGDVASAVAFLAGDESDFVNGTTLLVDGGWSAGKGY
jgi:NAD(P)-dependent dehydrogenase (short-subunit alcohol dehydrogenase family)